MGLFDQTIGAQLIGSAFACFLSGICSSQAFTFFRSGSNGSRFLTLLVAVCLSLTMFHAGTSVFTVYHWGVTYYGQVDILLQTVWSYSIEPVLTGLVGLIVQLYFAYELFEISGGNRVLPAVISLLGFVQFSWALASIIKLLQIKAVLQIGSFSYVLTVWLASTALVNGIITLSFIFYALREERTKGAVDWILTFIVKTNAITTSLAVVNASLFSNTRDIGWHTIPTLMLLSCSVNCLLVRLNSETVKRTTASMHDRSQRSALEINVKLANVSDTTTLPSGDDTLQLSGRSSKVPIKVEISRDVQVEDEMDGHSTPPRDRDVELGYRSSTHLDRAVKESHW